LTLNRLGKQFAFRFNTLSRPFDSQKVRQAAFHALNQRDILAAQVGDPKLYRVCKSYYTCGTPLATTAGLQDKLESNFARSRELLREAGYDGSPVLLMHPTDNVVVNRTAPVAKALLERGGFKVDMRAMDFMTMAMRVARRDAAPGAGWSAYISTVAAIDHMDPVVTYFLAANCANARFGWPCDDRLERLRDEYALEPDAAKRKSIAEAIQMRAVEYGTHVPLGEFVQQAAVRANVRGVLEAPVPIFWNIEKIER
jgi:peptide/nickel transport system substrate-binding protein